MIFKNIVKNNPSIKNSLSEHSINLICDLINPPEHLKDEWLYQIVCNKINHIDVDKIDYILRDSYHIGLPLQGEFSRLISMVKVCIFEDKKVLNGIKNYNMKFFYYFHHDLDYINKFILIIL